MGWMPPRGEASCCASLVRFDQGEDSGGIHAISYSNGLERPLGTPEAEGQAASHGAAALAAIEDAPPTIIAPEARQTLADLQQATTAEPSADGRAAVQPSARRSGLRAVRNALRALSTDALSSCRAGLRIGINTVAASALILRSLPPRGIYWGWHGQHGEFGWLSRLVAHVQSLI